MVRDRITSAAEVIELAEALGWTVFEPSKKTGYRKMTCGCGDHISWLHKTPSNPNYWAERARHLKRTCNKTDDDARDET